MSRWLLDLGNSRLKLAQLHDDRQLGEVVALEHAQASFLENLHAALPTRGESICLASVASPALTASVVDALTRHFHVVSIARSTVHLAGVTIAYAEPSKLGVDRFLALLGAHALSTQPWLIVGVGTAMTLDLMDAGGRHHGGRIAPSPTLMRQALHQAATQLPIEGGIPHEFANDTADALASGCEGAALGLVERSLREATRILGAAPALIMHGGGAQSIAGYFAQARLAPSLVLQGLAIWSRVGTVTL